MDTDYIAFDLESNFTPYLDTIKGTKADISSPLQDGEIKGESSSDESFIKTISRKRQRDISNDDTYNDPNAYNFQNNYQSSNQKKINESKSGLNQDQKLDPAITLSFKGEKLPPWVKPKRRSPSEIDLPVEQILNKEVQDFIDYISPTAEEHAIRGWVLDKLRLALKNLFKPTDNKNAEVICFGSYLTALYLPSSDLDVAVLITHKDTGKICEEYEDRLTKTKLLHKIANTIKKNGFCDFCEIISGARVPLVKTTEKHSKISIDISINATSGIKTAAIMDNFLKKDFPVTLRGLVLIVKQYLMQRHMNEVFTGGLGSYATVLLVVSFLQHHPKVSSHSCSVQENIGILLIEFFELYGKRFNYEHTGIVVANGGKYVKKELPYHGARNEFEKRSQLLYLEDPGDAHNDVAKSTFGMMRIKKSFSYAYSMLSDSVYKYHQIRKLGTTLNSLSEDNNSQMDNSPSHKKRHINIKGKKSSNVEPELKYDLSMPVSFLSSILNISNHILKKRVNFAELFYQNVFQNELGVKYEPKMVDFMNDVSFNEVTSTHKVFTPSPQDTSDDIDPSFKKEKTLKSLIDKFDPPGSPTYIAASSESSESEEPEPPKQAGGSSNFNHNSKIKKKNKKQKKNTKMPAKKETNKDTDIQIKNSSSSSLMKLISSAEGDTKPTQVIPDKPKPKDNVIIHTSNESYIKKYDIRVPRAVKKKLYLSKTRARARARANVEMENFPRS
ncbi:Poly(A) RNA polymerase cid14 [Smittium culicis]|uniref:polynucleotide adenylyltransferase n=1 Tax=Smittium culicis TaxID=133412 RepID=A0A1R1X0Z6_9FUNG|nr:Poly(A) RNA polymerase cid14 [Smittium culicis]